MTPLDIEEQLTLKARRAKRLPMNNEWFRLHEEMNTLLDEWDVLRLVGV